MYANAVCPVCKGTDVVMDAFWAKVCKGCGHKW